MFRFNYIQEFVVLAETLNFSQTAERCYITQPTLSRHITELEEEIGAKLFDRTTRTVSLTPAGKIIYDSFRQILTTYRAGCETASCISAGNEGLLKISSPYYWTADFMEPAIRVFSKKYPNCDVRLISCQPMEGFQQVLSGESDILLSIRWSNISPSVRRSNVCRERLCAACLSDHPLAGRKSLRMEDLKGYDIVTLVWYPDASDSYTNMIRDRLAQSDVYPKVFYYTQQIDTLGLTLRQHPAAVGIFPYGVRHMDRSYLRFIPLTDESCCLDMCIYYLMDNGNPLIPCNTI